MTMRHISNRYMNRGFTLLEVLIVVFILGLLAALAAPAVGYLDSLERERITREGMKRIRNAIVGPDDRFDDQGRPLVGGYVGDMRAWPDLWEARAEIRPGFAGTGWDNPPAMTAGLGQGPGYQLNASYVYHRPSGVFEGKRWKWLCPYRRLYDDPAGNDHIGGLETENEGQPRGLWTRYPEELPFDLPGHPKPGLDLGAAWKGPYLNPPADGNPSDADHWAAGDYEYAALEPTWHASGPHAGFETWEDGDNSPVTGEPGEQYDDKEFFRMLQNDGRLADGWGRAFRFFITADQAHAGETIFWIVSEGADGKGRYPSKGTCSGHSWSTNTADTMGNAYDENHAFNRDNIVMKLYSRDWRAAFDQLESDKTAATRRALERVRQALLGECPEGLNTGYSGDLLAWPLLFRWEGTSWDDRDASDTAYTKGQPRGLWTGAPNSADAADNLPPSSRGIGWRRAYLTPPLGTGAGEMLKDAWGRELLFFYDAGHDALLVLSRGADGKFAFGATNAGWTEPENFIEAVDVTAYDPASAVNLDNIHLVVRRHERFPGYFRLSRFVVLNATAGATKARFFRDNGAPVAGVDLLAAAVLTDEDSDGAADDWAVGNGLPAFNFDDVTAQTVPAGARYLVFWNDTDGDDEIDSGEMHFPYAFNVTATPGSGQYGTVRVSTADFRAAP